jgi:hypothetical protein
MRARQRKSVAECDRLAEASGSRTQRPTRDSRNRGWSDSRRGPRDGYGVEPGLGLEPALAVVDRVDGAAVEVDGLRDIAVGVVEGGLDVAKGVGRHRESVVVIVGVLGRIIVGVDDLGDVARGVIESLGGAAGVGLSDLAAVSVVGAWRDIPNRKGRLPSLKLFPAQRKAAATSPNRPPPSAGHFPQVPA